MKKIHVYFRVPPQKYRFIPGDQHLIWLLKKILRKNKTSGVKKVFLNLCKGFDELGVSYDVNLPFSKVKTDEPVVALGDGRFALDGYTLKNPVIAGIGLMTHPTNWPNICEEYPIAKYLQHSTWANNVYVPYFGADICNLWPAGIETDNWAPVKETEKTIDFLVYNKIRWDKDALNDQLKQPILKKITERGLTYREIVYGQYQEEEYFNLLRQSKAMIFLCEHESQGFACCEALSMNVPVFAWDQGFCLDPTRFEWNDAVIPATSVPFFDERCGLRFKDLMEFETQFATFWNNVENAVYNPRAYITENLTLKKSAQIMLDLINKVYQ